MVRLPPELIKLLETIVDGLEKVDVAWHVHTAVSPISLEELEQRTLLDNQTLRDAIRDLIAAGVLVANEPPFGRLVSGPRARSPDFELLMKRYTDDRVLVVHTATRIAMERIRNMAASTFADAFLIRPRRKKEEDDA